MKNNDHKENRSNYNRFYKIIINKLKTMRFFKFKNAVAISAMALVLFTSCDKDNNKGEQWGEKKGDFHIAFANGSGSISGTLVQGLSDLTKGTVGADVGWEMESSRTARIFASTDGATIYSLNYTVGTIEKLSYYGGDNYEQVGKIDASIPLGSKTVRFTKMTDELGSVHVSSATAEYEDPNDPSTYKGHKMTVSIGMLNLGTMSFGSAYNSAIDIVIDEALAKQGYYISRIDCPVISGNKLYYGAAVSKFNPLTGRGVATDRTFTLVVDYPSLTNATAISTIHVQGSTNGYRTPTQHVNEAGEILQMVSGVNATNGEQEVHIVKIKNGQYDTSFDFNLSKLINKQAASNGFFYARNGIAYIPYEDLTQEQIQIGVNPQGEPSYSSMWKLARMDFNNMTAVDLNVPDNLWLQQYQNGVVKDGRFYIALSPVGRNGNIYMFDVNSTSKDGKLGASLTDTGADQYYVGIY